MRILTVMVQLEVPCPGCGGPMMRLGNAAVTPDGRIGEPTPIDDSHRPCVKCQNEATAIERKEARQRRRFLMGKGKLKG